MRGQRGKDLETKAHSPWTLSRHSPWTLRAGSCPSAPIPSRQARRQRLGQGQTARRAPGAGGLVDAGPVSGGRSGCRRRLPGSPTRGSSTLRNQKDRRPCVRATWSVHAPSCRGRRSKSCRTAGRAEASGGGGRPSAPPHRAMAPGTSGPSVRVRPFDPSNPIEGTFLETIRRNGREHTHTHTHSRRCPIVL